MLANAMNALIFALVDSPMLGRLASMEELAKAEYAIYAHSSPRGLGDAILKYHSALGKIDLPPSLAEYFMTVNRAAEKFTHEIDGPAASVPNPVTIAMWKTYANLLRSSRRHYEKAERESSQMQQKADQEVIALRLQIDRMYPTTVTENSEGDIIIESGYDQMLQLKSPSVDVVNMLSLINFIGQVDPSYFAVLTKPIFYPSQRKTMEKSVDSFLETRGMVGGPGDGDAMDIDDESVVVDEIQVERARESKKRSRIVEAGDPSQGDSKIRKVTNWVGRWANPIGYDWSVSGIRRKVWTLIIVSSLATMLELGLYAAGSSLRMMQLYADLQAFISEPVLDVLPWISDSAVFLRDIHSQIMGSTLVESSGESTVLLREQLQECIDTAIRTVGSDPVDDNGYWLITASVTVMKSVLSYGSAVLENTSHRTDLIMQNIERSGYFGNHRAIVPAKCLEKLGEFLTSRYVFTEDRAWRLGKMAAMELSLEAISATWRQLGITSNIARAWQAIIATVTYTRSRVNGYYRGIVDGIKNYFRTRADAGSRDVAPYVLLNQEPTGRSHALPIVVSDDSDGTTTAHPMASTMSIIDIDSVSPSDHNSGEKADNESKGERGRERKGIRKERPESEEEGGSDENKKNPKRNQIEDDNMTDGSPMKRPKAVCSPRPMAKAVPPMDPAEYTRDPIYDVEEARTMRRKRARVLRREAYVKLSKDTGVTDLMEDLLSKHKSLEQYYKPYAENWEVHGGEWKELMKAIDILGGSILSKLAPTSVPAVVYGVEAAVFRERVRKYTETLTTLMTFLKRDLETREAGAVQHRAEASSLDLADSPDPPSSSYPVLSHPKKDSRRESPDAHGEHPGMNLVELEESESDEGSFSESENDVDRVSSPPPPSSSYPVLSHPKKDSRIESPDAHEEHPGTILGQLDDSGSEEGSLSESEDDVDRVSSPQAVANAIATVDAVNVGFKGLRKNLKALSLGRGGSEQEEFQRHSEKTPEERALLRLRALNSFLEIRGDGGEKLISPVTRRIMGGRLRLQERSNSDVLVKVHPAMFSNDVLVAGSALVAYKIVLSHLEEYALTGSSSTIPISSIYEFYPPLFSIVPLILANL